MSADSFEYVGQELDIFAHARNWKSYWTAQIRRYVHGDVLEVGAGIGANTNQLQNSDVKRWVCLEPDPMLASQLSKSVGGLGHCSVQVGTVSKIADQSFDSILYIDVLEHIEQDRQELEAAACLLRPGGHLIVLSPAHQFLYSPFDQSIGHFRRYTKETLLACGPRQLQLSTLIYLDAGGMITSFANRALLKQSMPTLRQVLMWDRFIIPVSRLLDPLLGYSLGKSVVGVWTARGQQE